MAWWHVTDPWLAETCNDVTRMTHRVQRMMVRDPVSFGAGRPGHADNGSLSPCLDCVHHNRARQGTADRRSSSTRCRRCRVPGRPAHISRRGVESTQYGHTADQRAIAPRRDLDTAGGGAVTLAGLLLRPVPATLTMRYGQSRGQMGRSLHHRCEVGQPIAGRTGRTAAGPWVSALGRSTWCDFFGRCAGPRPRTRLHFRKFRN